MLSPEKREECIGEEGIGDTRFGPICPAQSNGEPLSLGFGLKVMTEVGFTSAPFTRKEERTSRALLGGPKSCLEFPTDLFPSHDGKCREIESFFHLLVALLPLALLAGAIEFNQILLNVDFRVSYGLEAVVGE